MQPMIVEKALPRDGNDACAQKARSVRVNLAESPLGWLHAHGRLSDRQFAAGEVLRCDYERAGLQQRTTMLWDAPPTGKTRSAPKGVEHRAVAQIDAHRRFHAAIDAAGPGLSDILWRVVCAGESLAAAEKGLQWPARAGKLVLAFALDRVADYYRIN